MHNKTKTKLQFILGGILMLTFAVNACNDSKSDKAVVTDSTTSTEVKTTVPAPVIKDSMDSIPGKAVPRIGNHLCIPIGMGMPGFPSGLTLRLRSLRSNCKP